MHLSILCQHSSLLDPMDEGFDCANLDEARTARPHAVRDAAACNDSCMRFVQRLIGLARRPMADGVEALRREFAETRSETLALARALRQAGVDPSTTVRHNDLGELTVAGWLAYLLQHPEQESRARLRG